MLVDEKKPRVQIEWMPTSRIGWIWDPSEGRGRVSPSSGQPARLAAQHAPKLPPKEWKALYAPKVDLEKKETL